MSITHTYVPAEARGAGIASQLTVAALELARQRGWVVRPVCTYTRETFLPAAERKPATLCGGRYDAARDVIAFDAAAPAAVAAAAAAPRE